MRFSMGALLAIAAGALGCRGATAAPPGDAGVDARPDATFGFATREQVFARSRAAIGLEVDLEDVRIADKDGRGVWITNGKRRVFVVPIDPSHVETLAVGARIHVRGTLVPAPAARQAVMAFAVRLDAARRIAASPHIIDAWSVTTLF